MSDLKKYFNHSDLQDLQESAAAVNMTATTTTTNTTSGEVVYLSFHFRVISNLKLEQAQFLHFADTGYDR